MPSPPVQPTSLTEEMPFAKEVYFTAVSQLRRCLEHVHFGELDMGASAPFVTGIVRSLARNSNAMLTLANLKSRDEHTYRHSVDVAVFATAFARHLGISEPQQHLAGMTGIFHDYGKSLTPLEILNAPRKLSPQEFGVRAMSVCGRCRAFPPKFLKAWCSITKNTTARDILAVYPGSRSACSAAFFPSATCITRLRQSGRTIIPFTPVPRWASCTGWIPQAWAPGLVEHFIRMIGIYPAGTAVLLSDGRRGIVGKVDSGTPPPAGRAAHCRTRRGSRSGRLA